MSHTPEDRLLFPETNSVPGRLAVIPEIALGTLIGSIINNGIIQSTKLLEAMQIVRMELESLALSTSEINNGGLAVYEFEEKQNLLLKQIEILQNILTMSEPAQIIAGALIATHVLTRLIFPYKINDLGSPGAEAVKFTLLTALDIVFITNAVFLGQVIDLVFKGGMEYFGQAEEAVMIIGILGLLFNFGQFGFAIAKQHQYNKAVLEARFQAARNQEAERMAAKQTTRERELAELNTPITDRRRKSFNAALLQEGIDTPEETFGNLGQPKSQELPQPIIKR